jgi:hypothetical protein
MSLQIALVYFDPTLASRTWQEAMEKAISFKRDHEQS